MTVQQRMQGARDTATGAVQTGQRMKPARRQYATGRVRIKQQQNATCQQNQNDKSQQRQPSMLHTQRTRDAINAQISAPC